MPLQYTRELRVHRSAQDDERDEEAGSEKREERAEQREHYERDHYWPELHARSASRRGGRRARAARAAARI